MARDTFIFVMWDFYVCFFCRDKISSNQTTKTPPNEQKEGRGRKRKGREKMTEPVLLRVKLPPSSPVISKTFKVPPDATVHSAVSDVIGKSLQQTISVNSNYGMSF